MSRHATADALTAVNTGKTNCTFCKGNHNKVECHVVTDVQERKKILRNTGHRFLCLCKAGHLARECDACIKCFAVEVIIMSLSASCAYSLVVA